MKSVFHNLVLLPFLTFLALACMDDKIMPEPDKGTLNLFFANVDDEGSGRLADDANPSAIFMSVKDEDGNVIFQFKKFSLIKVGDDYITENIEFEVGNYTIEDFIVVNEIDTAIYLTPKEGSALENLVSDPLPVSFEISPEETTSVTLEVISSTHGEAVQFGYTVVSFHAVHIDLGLIAYYPFDGNAEDSISSNHGTIEGNPAFVPGKLGDAIHFTNPSGFNQITQWVTFPYSDELKWIENTSFTISMWFKSANSERQNGRLFASRNATEEGVRFNYNRQVSDMPTFVVSDTIGNNTALPENRASGGTPEAYLTNNEWRHVVFGLDRTTEKFLLYIDGVFIEETAITLQKVTFQNLILGATKPGDEYGARNTSIDELRIYDRFLTAPEIRTLYSL